MCILHFEIWRERMIELIEMQCGMLWYYMELVVDCCEE